MNLQSPPRERRDKGFDMSVNVGQRHVPDTPSSRQCYAVDACFQLCIHILKITQNEKVFLSEHGDLIGRIRELATGIYTCAYSANKTNVTKDPSKWKKRRGNQESALDGLIEMLALIPVARTVFHLRRGKTEYWTKLTKNAYDLTKKWYEADVDRYSVPIEV